MPTESHSMLLVVGKFGRSEADRYLTNDLADAFARRGFDVTVVVIPWDSVGVGGPKTFTTATGVRVLECPPVHAPWLGRLGGLLAKWVGSSWRARRYVRRQLGDQRFDLVFAMSPLVTQGFILRWAVGRSDAAYAHLVDFFPFHHHSIGSMPGGPFLLVGAMAETWLARHFDVVGGMSPAGETYLKHRYRLKSNQTIATLPLWGPQTTVEDIDRAAVRRHHALPTERPIAVFGGQITLGRGIEDILATAALSRASGSDLVFLLIGRGGLTSMVRQAIEAGADNVLLRDHVERTEYLRLVASCDVGLVATVPNVDVPTFPSKTIDYLRAGVPVVASVERSTDFGDFIRVHGFGRAVEAGNPGALHEAIEDVVRSPQQSAAMAQAGRRTLADVLNPDLAVQTVLAQLAGCRDGPGKQDRGAA